MIKLPNSTIWNQNNRGDTLGDIWSSYNLNLTTNLGKLRASQRLIKNMDSSNNLGTNSTSLGIPWGAKFFSSGGNTFWVGAGSFIFTSTTGLDGTFTKDSSGNTPTGCDANISDIDVFNNALYVSAASTSMWKYSSGSWAIPIVNIFNNASGLHDLEFFRAQNRLYFVDDNAASIGSINTSDVAASLGSQYTLQNLVTGASGNTGASISWMKSNSQYIFIGTLDAVGKQGKVYYWDGSQTTPNGYVTLEANGSLAGIIKDDTLVIIDTKGRILQLNGQTFVELARLPYDDRTPPTYFNNATDRLMHYNGISLINNRIDILIKGTLFENGSFNKENLPSGVWEYTQETGLYHKSSIGITKSSETIIDYGQEKLLRVGCLAYFEAPVSVTLNGRYVVGCQYYIDATNTLFGLFYDDTFDTLQKYAYLVTPKLYATPMLRASNVKGGRSKVFPSITNSWESGYAILRQFLAASDVMSVKFRFQEVEPTEATVTWFSTTLLYSTAAYSVGDEIEILQGTGAGKTTHITTVESSGSGYYYGLDETFTGVTNSLTGVARFQNWKKAESFQSQNIDYPNFSFAAIKSTWIQIKVCFLWTGKNELHHLQIINSADRFA